MTEQNSSPKKGKATPPRKQQEEARKRPLIAPRTKEGKQAAAAKMRAERIAAREGFAAGDDKYLPKRDAGPARRLIRDVVDAGWFTVGELLLPLMIVSILIPPTQAFAIILNLVLLSLFALFLADTFLITRRARKRLEAKFGKDRVEKGVWIYVAFMAMYPRILRLPKAQVPRGHKF
jgi:hypothetical protein